MPEPSTLPTANATPGPAKRRPGRPALGERALVVVKVMLDRADIRWLRARDKERRVSVAARQVIQDARLLEERRDTLRRLARDGGMRLPAALRDARE